MDTPENILSTVRTHHAKLAMEAVHVGKLLRVRTDGFGQAAWATPGSIVQVVKVDCTGSVRANVLFGEHTRSRVDEDSEGHTLFWLNELEEIE